MSPRKICPSIFRPRTYTDSFKLALTDLGSHSRLLPKPRFLVFLILEEVFAFLPMSKARMNIFSWTLSPLNSPGQNSVCPAPPVSLQQTGAGSQGKPVKGGDPRTDQGKLEVT